MDMIAPFIFPAIQNPTIASATTTTHLKLIVMLVVINTTISSMHTRIEIVTVTATTDNAIPINTMIGSIMVALGFVV